MKNAQGPTCKQHRYLAELSKYDANIDYQKGSKNYLADALSWLYEIKDLQETKYFTNDTIL